MRPGSFLVLLLALANVARAGSVVTRDGKTIEGAVAPVGAQITVTDAAGHASTFSLVDLRSVEFVAAPLAAPATQPSWKHVDIGKVHAPGEATESGGVFKVAGSGWGFWGPKDSGHFVYWPFEGDGQLIAHVTSAGVEGGPRAGLMFRESLEPDAPFAAGLVYPSGVIHLNRRPNEGNVAGDTNDRAAPHEWLRLTRAGDRVAVYRSRDGRFWQQAGNAPTSLAAKGYAGLAVSAGFNNRLGSATFDHVRLIPGTPATTFFDGATGPERGIVMTDGSMLAGWPDFIDGSELRLWPRFGADGQELARPKTDEERKTLKRHQVSLPVAAVARLRMAPEPPDVERLAPANASGVLLLTGDFVEGEIDRLTYGTYLDLKSVLFGAKRMDVNKDAISIVLRGVTPRKATWEVHTRDGSAIQADAVSFEGGFVNVQGATVGAVRWPTGELVAIKGQP